MTHEPITIKLNKRVAWLEGSISALIVVFLVTLVILQSHIDTLENLVADNQAAITDLRSQIITLSNKIQPTTVDSLLDAMSVIESSNNPKAYNAMSGAVGLLQLTPVIYDKFCGITKEDAFDGTKNRACAKLYLTHLMNKYDNNVPRALKHYNSGYMNVETKYVEKVMNVVASNN